MQAAMEINISDTDDISICSSTAVSEQPQKSIWTHDYEREMPGDIGRMEEVGCFDHLPFKDRLKPEEPKDYQKEAAWIAKKMCDLPKASEYYTKKELAKTIENLLPRLLEEGMSPHHILAYEEHMLLIGGKNRQLSTFDLFCILELDREWGLFISTRNSVIKQLKSPKLKEFLMLKISSMNELRVISLAIFLDIGRSAKGIKACCQLIDKLFQPSELSPAINEQMRTSLQILRQELETFCKGKKFKQVDHASLEQLAARIASVEASEIDPTDMNSLVLNSAEVMLEAYSKLIAEVKIKTSPVPFGSQKGQFDFYHDLYPTKRINNLPLKNMQDDLMTKIALAEKAELIKTIYTWKDKSDPKDFLPEIIMNAVIQVFPNVPAEAKQKLDQTALAESILIACMKHPAQFLASLSSLSELHRHICEDIPIEKKLELRDTLAYGVKVDSSVNLRKIFLVITHGAEPVAQKEIMCGNDPTDEELKRDLALDEELSQCLRRYFPKVVTIDCTTRFGIQVAQKFKEEVAKLILLKPDLKTPVYFTKKCIIAERRAYSLDKKLNTAKNSEFMFLIAYSLACSGQDRLLESLKLRFTTKDFPYIINDCVKHLDPQLRLRLWDFVLKHRLSRELLTTDELIKLPPAFYVYMHCRKSIFEKPSELLLLINDMKACLEPARESVRPPTPKKRKGKKIVSELEPTQKVAAFEINSDEVLKKTEKLFKGTIGCVFIMGTGEISLPPSCTKLCSAVKAALAKTNKSERFIKAYIENFQLTIRAECQQTLLDRKTNCDLTKAIFSSGEFSLSTGTFLKISTVLSRLNRLQSILSLKNQGQIGQLPPSLFWPTQAEPMSHESLVNSQLSHWASELQMYRVIIFTVKQVFEQSAKGVLQNGLPATLNFKTVGLDSHQEVEAKAVQMYLKTCDSVEVRIDKLNHHSCLVFVKLFLNKDNPKQYLSANNILTRYGLVDAKTFRVNLEEDVSNKGMSVDLLNKSSKVAHPRDTAYLFFRNWKTLECKKELDQHRELTHLFCPLGKRSIQLLWKVREGLIATDEVEIFNEEQDLEGPLKLRDKIYDGMSQISTEFVNVIQKSISDLVSLSSYKGLIDQDNAEAQLMAEMLASPNDQFWYLIGLSSSEPGKGVIATLFNFSYPDIFSRSKLESETKRAFLFETFSIDSTSFEFHREKFLSLNEMIGWIEISRSEDDYYSHVAKDKADRESKFKGRPAEEWDGSWFLGEPTDGQGREEGRRGPGRGGRGGDRGQFLGKRSNDGWQRDTSEKMGNRDSNFGEKRSFNRQGNDDIPATNSGAGWGANIPRQAANDESSGWGRPKAAKSPSPEVVKKFGFETTWGNITTKNTSNPGGWGSSNPTNIDEDDAHGWGKQPSTSLNQATTKQSDISIESKPAKEKNDGGWGKKINEVDIEEDSGWSKPVLKKPEVAKNEIIINKPETPEPKGWGKVVEKESESPKWTRPTQVAEEPQGWGKKSKPVQDNSSSFAKTGSPESGGWGKSPTPQKQIPQESPAATSGWGKRTTSPEEATGGWNKGTITKAAETVSEQGWGKVTTNIEGGGSTGNGGWGSSHGAGIQENRGWNTSRREGSSNREDNRGDREGRGGYRGDNRVFRGGYRGDRGGDRGERGGYRGDRDSGRGDFRGGRGGYRGDGDRGGRGGYRGDRDSSRGGYRGDRDGERGNYRGDNQRGGGYRGRGNWSGGERNDNSTSRWGSDANQNDRQAPRDNFQKNSGGWGKGSPDNDQEKKSIGWGQSSSNTQNASKSGWGSSTNDNQEAGWAKPPQNSAQQNQPANSKWGASSSLTGNSGPKTVQPAPASNEPEEWSPEVPTGPVEPRKYRRNRA